MQLSRKVRVTNKRIQPKETDPAIRTGSGQKDPDPAKNIQIAFEKV